MNNVRDYARNEQAALSFIPGISAMKRLEGSYQTDEYGKYGLSCLLLYRKS